jgi:hypothetical protein
MRRTGFIAFLFTLIALSFAGATSITTTGAGGRTAAVYATCASATPTENVYGGFGTYTIRQTILEGAISCSGTTIRITFMAGTGFGITITNAYIQEQAAAGNAWDYTTTPVQIMFSGGASTVIAAGGTAVSDDLAFTFDGTKDYVIGFYNASGATSQCRGLTTLANYSTYYLLANDAATVAPGGYTTGVNMACISKIEAK